MTNPGIVPAIAAVLLILSTSADSRQAPKESHGLERLPRDLEVQLALSALPPHLRDAATVYVLDPHKGFEIARKGTNGFHAIVARTGDDAMQGSWPLTTYPDDILYPISFDEAGAKTNLRVFLDIADMQSKGTPPQELKRLVQQRYKTGYYQPPARAGVSYMLSPILRTYVNPDHMDKIATVNFPHVMYYVPNVSAKDVGAATPTPEQLRDFDQHGRWLDSPYPLLIHHGPHAYMVQARGAQESESITNGYRQMLAELCTLKKVWCLPTQ